MDISACENGGDIKKLILQQTEKICKENFVRVFLRGQCDEGLEKHLQLLVQDLAPRFFYFDIRDESKIRLDLEKIASETLSLKAEMIKLIYASDLSEEDKAACIKAGLSALRGEEVEI